MEPGTSGLIFVTSPQKHIPDDENMLMSGFLLFFKKGIKMTINSVSKNLRICLKINDNINMAEPEHRSRKII